MIIQTRTAAICIAVMIFLTAGTLSGQNVVATRVQTVAQLLDLARAQQPELVKIRRWIHQHPELRWQETNTIAFHKNYMASVLLAPGYSVEYAELEGGLLAWLKVNPSYKWIMQRAEMDGLPFDEETKLPFSSVNKGVMHACGHDGNQASLDVAFRLIASGAVKVPYNILFVFERSEENPSDQRSGAKSLVQAGILKEITAAYGLHMYQGGDPGTFYTNAKQPMFANNDQWGIFGRTVGGHVAWPHKGVNSIDVGVDVLVAMRDACATLVGPTEPCAIDPATFLAGIHNSANVRPGPLEIWVSARNFLEPARRKKLADDIGLRVNGILSSRRDSDPQAVLKYQFVEGYPYLVNDPKIVAKLTPILQQAGLKVDEGMQELGSESFAYYADGYGDKKGVPIMYVMLGAPVTSPVERSGGHHSANFDFDEAQLSNALCWWLCTATH